MSEEFKPIPLYRDSLLRSINENGGGGGGGGGGGCDCDMTLYLLKEDAKNTYQSKGDYAKTINGIVPYEELPADIKPNLTDYIKTDDADKKYQTKGDYATLTDGRVPYAQLPEDIKPNLSDYLKTKDADTIYQAKGDYATTINGRVPYTQLPEDIKPNLSDYLKTEDANTKFLAKGDYATLTDGRVPYTQLPIDIKPDLSKYAATEALNNNVKKLVELEQILVPFYDEINSYDSLRTYIRQNADAQIDIEGNQPGTDYYFMTVAEIETLKICYNTYYRVCPDSVVFDTADDYIFIHCKSKPIIGSLFVFTFENPSGSPVIPMVRGFAHYYGEYIIDYYPKQGYHVFGTDDRHNCDWDEASKRFRINYSYSTGWRIHADSFKLFFFTKLPDYAPLDMCSISTSLIITNDKGKSNGVVPLNEGSKVDKKYLDNYITVEEADQKYVSKTTTTTPSTSEPTIDPTLQKCLDEDGVVIEDEEYKRLLVNVKGIRLDNADLQQKPWDGGVSFSIQSTRRILPGSVFSYYYDESNGVHRGYFIFTGLAYAFGLNNSANAPCLDGYRIENDRHFYEFCVDNPCSKQGHHDETYVKGDEAINYENMWCYTDYKSDLDLLYPINSIITLEEGIDVKIVCPIEGMWEKLFSQTIEGKTINYFKRVA